MGAKWWQDEKGRSLLSKYWIEREAENRKREKKDDEVLSREISEKQLALEKSINKEIEAFYGRYATKEGMTLADAKKRIKTADVKELSALAEKMVPNKDMSDYANERMRLYNATMRINRLEALKAQIGLDMVEAYEGHYRDLEKRMLQKGLEDARKNAGILGHTIPENYDKWLESILDSSFHNAKWSERLWHDQDALKMALDKELTRGIMLGEHPRDIARRMAGQFDVGRAALFRLVVTETTRLQIAVQEDSYKRSGIDWYEYIATIDDRTSKICTQLNMKHFPVSQMKSGVNAPPMHPYCRSSTAPYVPDEEEEAALNKEFGIMGKTLRAAGKDGVR